MRGFTGDGNWFHADRSCPSLDGHATDVYEAKALKWGMEYCPDCFGVTYRHDR